MLAPDDEALTQQVLAGVASAGRPVALRDIQNTLGARSKADRERVSAELTRLVAFGELHLVSGRLYWDVDPTAALAHAAERILGAGPVTRAALLDGLREAVPVASEATRREAATAALGAAGVHKWPGRTPRYALRPPNPDRGAAEDNEALLRRLDALVQRLEANGEDRAAIARRVAPNASAAPAVTDATGMAFQLVLAWRDFPDPTTRKALERLMLFLGMVPVGRAGETVGFDGIRHTTTDDLWPDDPAVVEVPGWGVRNDGFVRVLEKSRVRAVTAQGDASKGAR